MGFWCKCHLGCCLGTGCDYISVQCLESLAVLVNLSGNLSFLGLSIPSGIQKEENLFSLVPNRVCFGSDGLISNESSTYDGPRVFLFRGGHVEGNPPHFPLAYLR